VLFPLAVLHALEEAHERPLVDAFSHNPLTAEHGPGWKALHAAQRGAAIGGPLDPVDLFLAGLEVLFDDVPQQVRR